MQKNYVIAGIVVIVMGIIIFLIGFYIVLSIEAYRVPEMPLDEFLDTMTDEGKATYQLGKDIMVLGPIISIIGLLPIIIGLVLTDKKQIPTASSVSSASPEAMNILMTRYAKGEITKEEFEALKKDLEKAGDVSNKKEVLVYEKTGKPIAGGILSIVASSLIFIVGFFYLFFVLQVGYRLNELNITGSESNALPFLIYFIISIMFCFLAFSIGLAGGILSIKRTNFSIAVFGSALVIVASCLTIIVFFISIPTLILGILSTVFVAASKSEFIVTK